MSRVPRLAAAGLFVFAVLLIPSRPADARYARMEIEKVPVERLAKNLEEQIAKDPKNVQAVINLARVHAMAYTLKSEELPTAKGKPEAVWFGYEPKLVPFGVPAKTDDPAKLKAAKEHLEKSIALYKKAVEFAPENLPARLGYAWVIEQAGRKDEAVALYRKLIADAWVKEKDLRSLPLGGSTVTGEAAGYLIPLLDPTIDRDEIATLKERSAQLQKLPRPITPIAVPLRDGLSAIDLEDRTASVAFDADGSGLAKQWTWITPDAAWLVFDPQASGRVTSGLQLFGNVTFWLFWDTGYDALAGLDDNRDGRLSGAELRGLALWHDVNRNGVSEPGEVRSLGEYGIVAIDCRYERDASHPDRIAYSRNGVTFRDGRTRPTFDLVLHPMGK
jgi:hypothetical protein